jgi:CheY-like chemotaxis protein
MTNASGTPSVLLVDPHEDSREMYVEYFRQAGLTPVAVDNAADAFAQAPGIDVVVTGILLNGAEDGVELVHRLRRDLRTAHKPVIVLTACVSQAERERAQRAGCDVFLPKPCAPPDLLNHVRRVHAASVTLCERASLAQAQATEARQRADVACKQSVRQLRQSSEPHPRRCPQCSSLAGRPSAAHQPSVSDADCFHCDSCGHVWFEPRPAL